MRLLLTLLLCCFGISLLSAQSLSGIIVSNEGPMANVVVSNIHTAQVTESDPSGRFTISGSAGQLLEFRKMGYQTARLRLSAGNTPFYKIMLEQGVQELDEVEVKDHFTDYKHDSLRFREYFKKQLDYNVVTGWRAFQSPFSALSKTNRQMMSFQKEYAWLEQMKYVDYNFNEKIIANLTGLKGDSALAYIRRYRPSYEQLRAMKEYEYFSYIKHTVNIWRERQRYGPSNSRGSGGG